MLDGDPSPLPPPKKKGTAAPLFGPCLLCQTAGWINVPLGTAVGRSPGH